MSSTTIVAAEQIAFDFLMTDLNLSLDDREWFTVLNARSVDDRWYVVEIGVEGFPDKWILQVWDTGVCDPSYTFISPIKGNAENSDLIELPESVATMIAAERSNHP
ncbi:MAG: hypothetical protein MUF72_13955 [Elainella sp. Prado103]|jgi:hypothetical protein|nr:hypothetical protein [Elainella sp. Prado103]